MTRLGILPIDTIGMIFVGNARIGKFPTIEWSSFHVELDNDPVRSEVFRAPATTTFLPARTST